MQSSPKKQTKYDLYTSSIDPTILKEWTEIQLNLKSKLIEYDKFNIPIQDIKLIAGLDISASQSNPDIAIAALVICSYPDLSVLYEKYTFVQMNQPYIPGFLAFREVSPLELLINEVKLNFPNLIPDLLLIDGNGILHSNGFGLASHLGVLVDIPTIGCGKTVFNLDGINKKDVKTKAKTLSDKGDYFYLQGNSGKIYGAAVKATDESSDPMIISIGHRIGLDTALDIIKKTTLYRVPEPIRYADRRSRVIIREYDSKKAFFDINEYIKTVKNF